MTEICREYRRNTDDEHLKARTPCKVGVALELIAGGRRGDFPGGGNSYTEAWKLIREFQVIR